MAASFDRGALLGDYHLLENGLRVRLRMARSSDLIHIRGLLSRVRRSPGDLELARLVQFDPRRQCVLCATALIDSMETLVGVGSIALTGEGLAEPDALIVGPEHAEAVAELLTAALVSRAAQAGQARAA
jgi:hypothetical protein